MSGTECGMLEKKQEGRFFMYIGNHLSSAKGYEAMGKQAVRLGGETQEVERQKRLSLRMWKNF